MSGGTDLTFQLLKTKVEKLDPSPTHSFRCAGCREVEKLLELGRELGIT